MCFYPALTAGPEQGSPGFKPKPVGTEANLHSEWRLVALGALKGYSF